MSETPERPTRETIRQENREIADGISDELKQYRRTLADFSGCIERAESFLVGLSDDNYAGIATRNRDDAFARTLSFVHEAFDKHQDQVTRTGEDGFRLTIQILAVVSTHSWTFIESIRDKLTLEFKEERCDLQWLLVNPRFLGHTLKRLNAHKTNYEMPIMPVALQRPVDYENLRRNLDSKVIERFNFLLRHYKAIPAWHGVMVGDEWLLRGETKFIPKDDGHVIGFGENYKIFRWPGGGYKEIENFRQWFRFYWNMGRPL